MKTYDYSPPAGHTTTVRLVGVLALLAVPAAANVALWHPSMYGFEAGKSDATRAAEPFSNARFADWWIHGAWDQPPADGAEMVLPVGGQFKGELASSKAFTTYADSDPEACEEDSLPKASCALALAYVAQVTELYPQNFTVISVRHDCSSPEITFDIPENLPECPTEGCHCLWGAADGTDHMYTNTYRCRIEGGFKGKPQANPLPVPRAPLGCRGSPDHCTKGAKQMLFWGQAERNNAIGGGFNADFGFADGAQLDIWQVDERKPSAKVLRDVSEDQQDNGDNGGEDWDQKWYQQTWTAEELLAPWTDEEQGYIDKEVQQHWKMIMNEQDYGVLDLDQLSVPAQYIVRKLRAQLWLATASPSVMPQTKIDNPVQTPAPAKSDSKSKEEEAKKKADEEAKKKDGAADAKEKEEEAKKKKEEEEKKKKEEEEKKKKKEEEEKKKKEEGEKKETEAPDNIIWGHAHLDEYIQNLRDNSLSLTQPQIEILKKSHQAMQADHNYPPDLEVWWRNLRAEQMKFPTTEKKPAAKREDDKKGIKIVSFGGMLAGKRDREERAPHPTAAPGWPAQRKREVNIDWDAVAVNTLQDVQTTQLLMLKPNAAQEEPKTEGMYTTKAEGPVPTPVTTFRGPPANVAPQPTPKWKPGGSYKDLETYMSAELSHNPNFKLSTGQEKFIQVIEEQKAQGWDGTLTQDIWDMIFSLRTKEKRWWVKENGKDVLQDWDTRTYRDDDQIDRYLRKVEWTDEEIRGINRDDMGAYNSLVKKVEELGGWSAGAVNMNDHDLDEKSQLRWPEIYVLRKIRFTKEKLRNSVAKYFEEHQTNFDERRRSAILGERRRSRVPRS